MAWAVKGFSSVKLYDSCRLFRMGQICHGLNLAKTSPTTLSTIRFLLSSLSRPKGPIMLASPGWGFLSLIPCYASSKSLSTCFIVLLPSLTAVHVFVPCTWLPTFWHLHIFTIFVNLDSHSYHTSRCNLKLKIFVTFEPISQVANYLNIWVASQESYEIRPLLNMLW
jgi:hypothetical protein